MYFLPNDIIRELLCVFLPIAYVCYDPWLMCHVSIYPVFMMQ